MALNDLAFDDLIPGRNPPAPQNVGSSAASQTMQPPRALFDVSFDDLTPTPGQQSLPGNEQREAISAPSTEVSQNPLPQGTWGDVFSRPFTGAGDRMRGALEGMKAFGAMVGERELSLQDPMSSDAGRVMKLADDLRKNPSDADLRSSIEIMGVNPDDLISTDINTAFGARNVLSGKLRNVRLANDDYVKSSLQRGKEAMQRVEKTRVDYGDTAKGNSQQFIEDILTGSVDMIPAIVASAITGPATGAAIMGGQVLGHSTLEGMNELGLTPDGAGLRSMAFAGAEFVPEIWALKIFKDTGGSRLTKILKAAGAEGLQEGITQTIQTGIDLGIDVKEDMTLGEFINEVGYSMAVGAGVGATLRTPMAMLEGKEQSPLDAPPAPPASATPPPAAPVAPDMDKEVTFDDLMAEAPVDTAPQPAADTLRTVQPGESIEVVPQPLPGEAPAADTTLRTVEPGESLPVEPQPLPEQAETLQEPAPTETVTLDTPPSVAPAKTETPASTDAMERSGYLRQFAGKAENLAAVRQLAAEKYGPEAAAGMEVEVKAAWNAQQQQKRRRVSEDDSLAVAVAKLGGIKTEWKMDITGDTKGNKMVPGVDAVFSKNGTSPDDMVIKLWEAGYITQPEIDDRNDNGGVNLLYERLRGEMGGGKKYYQIDSTKPIEDEDKAREDDYYQQVEYEAAIRDQEYAALAAEHGQEAADIVRQYDDDARAYAESLDAQIAIEQEAYQARLREIDNDDLNEVAEADTAARDEQVRQSIDAADRSQREAAENAAGQKQEVDPPAFDLSTQTEEDLRADASKREAETQRERDAGKKAQADEEVSSFSLAGSNSTVDQAEARGQMNVFDAPASPQATRPLSEIEVTETFEAEDTGKEVTVTMAADKALADIDSRIDSIKALVACLKAAA